MSIFKWFHRIYQKLKWVVNFLYAYLTPIYDELVKVIKAVKESNLQDDAARKEVFKRITAFIQARGLKISDSKLNALIEIVYQLVKAGRE